MKRSASAQWRGNLRQGKGILNSESGALSKLPYSFAKRFGDEKGTNPEELIGAAHSGCFAMAFSGELEKKNLNPETIDVKAIVSLEKKGEGWAINAIHLDVRADVPGGARDQIEEAAQSAKKNCPVSQLLNAEITMNLDISSQESAAYQ